MIAQRYGGLKILLHPEKLAAMMSGTITAPIYVRLKPTNRCNHHCSFCSYDPAEGDKAVRDSMNDRRAEIPKEKLFEIISDFKEIGVKAITFSGGGEPLVHPNITEAMSKTLESGINLSIITNGQCLNGERAEVLANANWVRVSSDASDAKSFAEIRKVPESWFYELTDNLKNFARIKKPSCEFGINFVVHPQNADQVYRSVEHFKKIGLNHVKITPRWVSNFREYHAPIKDSVLEQVARAKQLSDRNFAVYDTYENDFSLSGVSERKYSRCYIMQTVPAIGADCMVYFCHDKAYASSGVLGSIKERSFRDLWFSEEAKKTFMSFDPSKSCKHHCANDSKNVLVNNIFKKESMNINISQLLDCYGPDIDFI